MTETYVRLLCPDCDKHWEDSPGELPEPSGSFRCPDCGERRRLSEFARTEHDLRNMERL